MVVEMNIDILSCGGFNFRHWFNPKFAFKIPDIMFCNYPLTIHPLSIGLPSAVHQPLS